MTNWCINFRPELRLDLNFSSRVFGCSSCCFGGGGKLFPFDWDWGWGPFFLCCFSFVMCNQTNYFNVRASEKTSLCQGCYRGGKCVFSCFPSFLFDILFAFYLHKTSPSSYLCSTLLVSLLVHVSLHPTSDKNKRRWKHLNHNYHNRARGLRKTSGWRNARCFTRRRGANKETFAHETCTAMCFKLDFNNEGRKHTHRFDSRSECLRIFLIRYENFMKFCEEWGGRTLAVRKKVQKANLVTFCSNLNKHEFSDILFTKQDCGWLWVREPGAS